MSRSPRQSTTTRVETPAGISNWTPKEEVAGSVGLRRIPRNFLDHCAQCPARIDPEGRPEQREDQQGSRNPDYPARTCPYAGTQRSAHPLGARHRVPRRDEPCHKHDQAGKRRQDQRRGFGEQRQPGKRAGGDQQQEPA
jgi:hypothetical protein